MMDEPSLTFHIKKFYNTHVPVFINNTNFRPLIGGGGRRGHDCMVVGFTTTCAISAYRH
jgi:hypothetical protein